ncbi:hypothetical protein INT48_005923 [Thamnidium elegans]|uniref:PAN2-PAN3 deadenylation complex catalytic subunit PAN2 n=1 Tax=Thamnidium elegans TaxID=101142 RepID=A0A8H7VTV5_9FUNG|nr:hypothetical protein INT48_005923 [Thamnidium elegans]
MDSSWSEVQHICNSNLNKVSPVSAVCWDPYHELLWVGNDSGRVSSYYGKGLQRYTAFKAHKAEQVRQIRVTDRGIISLSPKSIQMRDRRGLVKWSISNEDAKDLHCMTSTTLTNGELLVAGQQDDMLVVSSARGVVTRKISGASNIVVLKSLPRSICAGSLLGEVTIRDPRTMKVEQRVQAHTATLSDLDVSGNLLLTLYVYRQGSLIMDPLVKVYDIRMSIRTLAPIPFPSGPMFLKMHPTLSTTCLVASQTGQFQMCDVSSLIMGSYAAPAQFHQIQSSSYITAMDISSSAQTLVFADGASFVYQYADREDFDVNPYSLPITQPDIVQPHTTIIKDDSPLSSVGMPYYTEQLLSVWPNNKIFEVGTQPTPIDEEIIKNMKTIDFVGYAPNPGNIHRNQIPRKKKLIAKKNGPKFRSEQERELLQSSNVLVGDEDGLHHSGRRSSSIGDIHNLDPNVINMPRYYQHVEIQYSKFGVDDFDFGYYNSTPYGGLETHIRNSYCNSFLQVLYFIIPLRKIAKSHIKIACPKDNCLLCELGFLFRMLEDSKGQNCQATNFLRAFSTIPQASALGLFDPETPNRNISFSTLMQNFTRFIMEQIHQESNITTGNPLISKSLVRKIMEKDDGEVKTLEIPSTMQQLFGLQTLSQSKCGACQEEVSRITYPFVVDMLYPKKNDRKSRKRSFTSILKASMYRENQTKAWCAICHQYQPTTTKKIICGLPGVMLINSGASNSEESLIWRQNGPNCSKTNQPTAVQEANADSDNGSPNEDVTGANTPSSFGIYINGSELMIKALPVGKEIPPEFKGAPETCAIYELSSTILQVQAEEELPHLVSQIKIPESELEPEAKTPWYLFNDFLVRKIRPEEVYSFKGNWKTPAVLQYTRVELDSLLELDVLPSKVDYSLLFEDHSIAQTSNTNPRHQVLSQHEMPTPGTLVAIDAEFVALQQEETEIRSDGTKSLIRPSTLTLARVSVLRGDTGPKEGIPFIDDYIATSEPVVDYLTEFSGIVAGDLDFMQSKHTLVPLKVAYKKLRLLVDLGCIFIGHGLNKDFRIINIMVPPEQIIDTVDIYHIRNRQRKISLRFLAWHLLQQDIQSETHDSIEDARTALILYKKYLEYKQNGSFGKVLEDIYEAGHKANWLKGPKDSLTRVSSTPQIEGLITSPLFTTGWPVQ